MERSLALGPAARRGMRGLRLGFWRRQCKGDHLRLKAAAGVSAIAEGLVAALPTPAEADDRAAGNVKWLAIGIEYFELALNAQ